MPGAKSALPWMLNATSSHCATEVNLLYYTVCKLGFGIGAGDLGTFPGPIVGGINSIVSIESCLPESFLLYLFVALDDDMRPLLPVLLLPLLAFCNLIRLWSNKLADTTFCLRTFRMAQTPIRRQIICIRNWTTTIREFWDEWITKPWGKISSLSKSRFLTIRYCSSPSVYLHDLYSEWLCATFSEDSVSVYKIKVVMQCDSWCEKCEIVCHVKI